MGAQFHRIGLTGGIGSGKSTVAKFLVQRGAALIDADAISRSVTAPGGLALSAVAAAFGPAAIAADGSMDREHMRQRVFADPDVKHRLEAIIHPLVAQATRQQADDAIASGAGCLVFDIPLLVESGRWRQQVDQVLVVDCSEPTQISRVLAREAGRAGWTQEAVAQVISRQASRAQRLAAADLVIYNDGLSMAALGAAAAQMAMRFGL